MSPSPCVDGAHPNLAGHGSPSLAMTARPLPVSIGRMVLTVAALIALLQGCSTLALA